MKDDNSVKRPSCFFHKICEEDEKHKFRKKYVEKLDNVVMTIFEEKENYFLYKAFVNDEDFTLVRDQNDKIDVWRVYEDFNQDDAVTFMIWWDKLQKNKGKTKTKPDKEKKKAIVKKVTEKKEEKTVETKEKIDNEAVGIDLLDIDNLKPLFTSSMPTDEEIKEINRESFFQQFFGEKELLNDEDP